MTLPEERGVGRSLVALRRLAVGAGAAGVLLAATAISVAFFAWRRAEPGVVAVLALQAALIVLLVVALNALARRVDARRFELERSFEEADLAALGNEATFNQVGVAVVYVDLDGRIAGANRRACELLGRDRQELCALGREDVTHPEDLAVDRARVKQLLEGPTDSYTTEKRYLRPDGEVVWAQTTVSLVRDRAERPVYLLGFLQDISQRKRAEATLSALSQTGLILSSSLEPATPLRAALEVLSSHLRCDCVLVTPHDEAHAAPDPAPEAVAHLARLIARHPEDHPGVTLVPSLSRAWVRNRLRGEQADFSAPLTGRSAIFVRLCTRDDEWLGQLVLVAKPGAPFTSEDVDFAGSFAQQASSALHNAALYARATSAVEARDEFLSCASHELRTPLTALSVHLRVLGRMVSQAPAPWSSTLGRPVQTLDQQVQRLTALATVLTDASLLNREQMVCAPARVDPCGFVQEVAARLSPVLAQAECALELELWPCPPAFFDPLRTEQILANLLQNASRYGAGAPVTLRVEPKEGAVHIVVKDRGIGISPKDQARIFGRFERAVPSRHYGGLGLGLYISRSLAHAMGGSLSVESRLNEGATFTLALPSFVPQAEG